MAENTTILNITAKDQTKAAFDSVQANIEKLNRNGVRANNNVDKASRQMRAGFQQAGYQIQDIAVQLQMGTSPFIVLAQQGSQVASIFGAGGAVVGAFIAVAGAVGMTMLPALFDSATALERLNEAGEETDKTFKALESGTLVLSDSFLEMAQASSVAATIELRRQRRELLAAIELTQAEMLEKSAEFHSLLARSNPVDPLTDVYLLGIGQAPEQIAAKFKQIYGVTEENMLRLQQLSKEAMGGSTEQIEAFVAALSEIQNQTGVTAEFNELAESLSALMVATMKGTEQVGQLESAMADIDGFINKSTESNDKNADSVEKMIQALQRQALTFDMSASQIAVYDAMLEGANTTQLTTIQQLAQEIESRERLKELAATEAKAIEDGYKSQMDALKVIERERSSGLSGTDKIEADFDERIRITYEALEELGWLETEHANLLIRLNQEKAAAVAQSLYDEEQARRETVQSQISLMSSMASSIANSLEEGTAVQKAAYVVSQGLAFADAIISAELASAKALALFPQNPAYAGMIKAMGYASAGVIAGQTVASFEGGGFTGYGARAGGIDGRGGMPAIVHPNETIVDHTMGGGAVNVNITIQANDTRGFDELLNKRRGMIASMVQSSLNNMGRSI
jgi:hypothetical protein